MSDLEDLAASARACRACLGLIPGEPRPVFQVSPTARLLIASQAPGSKVHASGIPFSDDSGNRLREWMGVTSDQFYDTRCVAIVPMGFCYPGRAESGDAPPRRECARLWRADLLEAMPQVQLTLLVGTYAQNDALGPGRMSDRVLHFQKHLPRYFPLPHPSWRSRIWMRGNPWFEARVLPELQASVRAALDGG